MASRKKPFMKNILVTGPPGCGKSTLVARIVRLIERPMIGFFTREIREGNQRVGFNIETPDGRTGLLAHVDIWGGPRVGKYGVNAEEVDRLAVPAMIPSDPEQVVVIDEIGKMECFSPLFKKKLAVVLDSQNDVLGAVSLKGDKFIESIKSRKDVTLIELTDANRQELVEVLAERFKGREK